MKVLATFPVKIDFHLNESQLNEAFKQLNIFYTGDPECNIKKGNKIISKYPEIERSRPEYPKSHYNASRCYSQTVQVELLENGSLRIKK